MLAAPLEAEVDAYLATHTAERDACCWHPGHGGGVGLQRGGDRPVGPAGAGLALVGSKQDAGAGRGGPLPDQGVKPGALGLGEDDGVLLAHAWLLQRRSLTAHANHD
jgi:hypothetical protein